MKKFPTATRRTVLLFPPKKRSDKMDTPKNYNLSSSIVHLPLSQH